MTQLDLFQVLPVGPAPRELTREMARVAEGHGALLRMRDRYVNGRGFVVETVKAGWTTDPPNAPGLWVSSDGRDLMVHRAVYLGAGVLPGAPEGLRLLGTSELVAGMGAAVSIERLGLHWFGPIPEPPESTAYRRARDPGVYRDWVAPGRGRR